MKKILIVLGFFCFIITMSSCDMEIDQLNYEYESHAIYQTADRNYGFSTIDKVTYLFDSDADFASVDSVLYNAKNVVIRDTITVNDYTYKVKRIGSGAFDKCVAVESISIGSNVTEILKEAFIYSYSLSYIVIPSTVVTAENDLFLDCNKDLKIYLESEKIPSKFSSNWNSGYDYVLGYKA